jgi:hypothetical protein
LLVQFLLQRAPLTLWVNSDGQRQVYPPAWAALGVDLRQLYFVESQAPLRDLHAVFAEPLFGVVVLDRPGFLAAGDYGFLAQRARSLGQVIMIIRPYLLSGERGNVQMRVRLNAFYDEKQRSFVVNGIKGMHPPQLRIELDGMAW